MSPKHEWKCTHCGAWNEDAETVTRCQTCTWQRPDIAEYRKVKEARAIPLLKGAVAILRHPIIVPGPEVRWTCDNCRNESLTTLPFCGECGHRRSMTPELRTRRRGAMPKVAAVLGIVSWLLLWKSTDLATASGVATLIFCNNLGRGR